MKNVKFRLGLCVVMVSFLVGNAPVRAEQISPQHFLIHLKTSLAEDNSQICAAPNVAWALVRSGHQVTILVDASAVTSVTKEFGWLSRLVHSDTTALDRATPPERERVSLAEQMSVLLEKSPHQYGEYLVFLKKLGINIYGNRTMMLLYNIDLQHVAPEVTPIDLNHMAQLFHSADRIIVY